MSIKPWGIYIISLTNLLLGLGVIGLITTVAYFGTTNLNNGSTDALIAGGFGFFLLLGIMVGVILLDTSFTTFKFKKRALPENTLIAVIILLAALGLLFIDFTIPASVYTGGEKPAFNLLLHFFFGAFALWNMYYLRKPTVRSLFVN